MPNWVRNEMSIPVLSSEESDRIAESLKGLEEESAPLSFERVIPRPAEEEDWYHWQIANWGTKWNACEPEVATELDSLVYSFNTAWSPPLPVLAAISDRFPDRTIRFVYEEEQGWGGIIEATGGVLVNVKDWDIPSTHAELIERKQECYCSDGDAFFADCYYERAKAAGVTDPRTLEAIKTLGTDWADTFERLIEVAPSL